MGFPRVTGAFVAGAQQALASELVGTFAELSLKVGMLPKVWKCSHGRPCGSTIQCLSLRA